MKSCSFYAYLKPSVILSGLGSFISSAPLVAGSATTVTVPNCISSTHSITHIITVS